MVHYSYFSFFFMQKSIIYMYTSQKIMVLNNQNKILLIFVLSALLTGTHMYSETACNISPPEITLIELHSGCHGSAKTRYPECVAAMHRYCQKTDYSTNKNHLIGISRENTDKFVSMSLHRGQVGW